MNGVEQAIFEEMLLEMRGHSALLRQLAAAGGGGSGPSNNGGAAGGLGIAGAAGKTLGIGFGVMSGTVNMVNSILSGAFKTALSLVGSGLSTLVRSTGAVYQGQMDLARASIDGTNGLSSFYESLQNLPGILGFAAQMFAYQSKVLEKNLHTFQELSQSGATLGGNLDIVRTSAKGMYLSMDEFANVMKTNTPYLLNFGQTADDGAKALIKFNTIMVQGSTGKALLGMGYSLEEANNMLGLYSSTLGGLNATQLSNQKGMEASVKSFATELTLSAELEGKTRKQKEDELKELAANAARENLLSKMSAEQKDAYLKAELAAGRAGGKAAQDALLSATLGLPPMTKAAQIYTAMHSEAAKKVTDLVPVINNSALSTAERQRQITQLGGEAAAAQVESSKKYGRTLDAISFGTSDVSKQSQETLRSEARARNQNLNSSQDDINRENKARDNLTKATEGQAGAVAQAAGAAKYQGEWLMDLLGKAVEPLRPILIDIVKAFTLVAPPVIKFATDVMTKFIMPLFNDVFRGIKLDDIIKPFRDFFKGLFGSGGLDFSAAEKGVAGFIRPMIKFIGNLIGLVDWEAVGGFIRKAVVLIADFAEVLFSAFSNLNWQSKGSRIKAIFERLGAAFDGLVSLFSDVFTQLGGMDRVTRLLNDVINVYIAGFNAIVAVIAGIVDFLTENKQTVTELFDAILTAFEGIYEIFEGIFDFISGDFAGGWNKIKEGLGKILTSLVEAFETLAEFVIKYASKILNWIFAGISSMFNNIVQGVKDLAVKVWDYIVTGQWLTDITDAVKTMFDGLVDAVIGLKNKVLSFIPGTTAHADAEKNDADAKIAAARKASADKAAADKAELQRYNSGGMTLREKHQYEAAHPDILKKQPASLPSIPKPVQNATPKDQPTRSAPKPVIKHDEEHKDKKPKTDDSNRNNNKTVNDDQSSQSDSSVGPGTQDAGSIQLNNNIQTMIRILRDIDNNTGKAVNIMAGSGNMFRR